VNVTAGYEGKTILDDVEWIIGPGERIGIVGANGAGKTTLLNVITQQITPQRGHVKVGKSVKFAVLSQRLKELEPVEDDYVRVVLGRIKQRYVVDGKEVSPGQLLERMGFERQQLNSRVMDLSGGQRRRLQLLLTLLAEPNVLILDEPGNDMDTDMLAVMEDLLDAWPGTLVLVTHDRYLMERVTDDQYALLDGKIRHLPGGVDEYLDIVAAREAADSSQEPAKPRTTDAPAIEPEAKPQRLSNKELHQARKDLASLERKLATAEKTLEQAKQAQLSIDPTDYEAIIASQQKVDEAQERKDALELEWLELAELVGE
jgi:ABC-type multidrug transport system ATPase subunit